MGRKAYYCCLTELLCQVAFYVSLLTASERCHSHLIQSSLALQWAVVNADSWLVIVLRVRDGGALSSQQDSYTLL